MSRSDGHARVDGLGAEGPPRSNGELVFASPWESRVFGMTLSLYESGLFEWDDFRKRLIREIAKWDERHPESGDRETDDYHYWQHWQAALESLLAERKLCAPGDLEDRVRAFGHRAPGHDHHL